MFINEVLSNPRVVDWDELGVPANAQWLELYNGGNRSVSLAGWAIRIGSDGPDRVPAPRAVLGAGMTIPAQGFVALFASRYGFELRQTPISLIDTNGDLVDSVSPPGLPGDQSYARMPDGSGTWLVTMGPTLNSPNVAPPVLTATPDLQATAYALQTQIAAPLPPEPTPPVFDDDFPDAFELDGQYKPARSRKGQPFQDLPIAAVRKLPDDSAVITRGVVTFPTGLWDPSRGYIQDGQDAGILVHSYNARPLPLGQNLTIRGRVHHVHGEVEVAAVKNGEQLSSGALPDVRPVAPGAVGPDSEALLVRIVGRVQSVERDYATVGGDAGSARVYLYSRLNLAASSLKDVPNVAVTGVVNADESRVTSSHRLLPRGVGDIITDATAIVALTSPPAGSGAPRGAAGATRGSPPSVPGQSASAGAAPTAFVTPVLSSRQAAASAAPRTQAGDPAGAVLAFDSGRGATPPPWLLAIAALGVVLLVGGTVVAFGPWFRGTAPGSSTKK